MAVLETFNPAYTQGITISVSTTSAPGTVGRGSKSLCLTNLGSETVYVRVSTGTVAATAADYPVLPGAQVSITKDQDMDTVSAITGASTSSLHVIPGEGF
jgi:hypothetical protein